MGRRSRRITAETSDAATTYVLLFNYYPTIVLTRLSAEFVPSSTMVPPRRLDTLLQQARDHQIELCNHHVNLHETSLYHDHICSRSQFPSTTTHILEGHTDEVWQVQWCHNGKMLASSGRDMTVIIWRIVCTFATQPFQVLNSVVTGSIKGRNRARMHFGTRVTWPQLHHECHCVVPR
jgi:WD40 repeat protein